MAKVRTGKSKKTRRGSGGGVVKPSATNFAKSATALRRSSNASLRRFVARNYKGKL